MTKFNKKACNFDKSVCNKDAVPVSTKVVDAEAFYKKVADGFSAATRAFADNEYKRLVDSPAADASDIESVLKGLGCARSAIATANINYKLLIDETPLTTADRAVYVADGKNFSDEAFRVMRVVERDAEALIESAARNIVARDLASYDKTFGKLPKPVVDKVVELAWDRAYDRSHSEGLSAVMDDCRDILSFLGDVLTAASEKK